MFPYLPHIIGPKKRIVPSSPSTTGKTSKRDSIRPEVFEVREGGLGEGREKLSTESSSLPSPIFFLLFPFLQIQARIHQIILDVVGDAVLKAMELSVATKTSQLRHVRLRVIPIAALQLGGHVGVVNIWDLIHHRIHRVGEVVPRAGLARTDVQDAVGFGMLQQLKYDVDAILHTHEIIHLATIGVLWAVGLE